MPDLPRRPSNGTTDCDRETALLVEILGLAEEAQALAILIGRHASENDGPNPSIYDPAFRVLRRLLEEMAQRATAFLDEHGRRPKRPERAPDGE